MEHESEVEQTTISYFKRIFSSSVISDLETSMTHVRSLVTSYINEILTQEVYASEVKAAVFSIHPEKAPVSNGMTAIFHQNFWHIIRPQVVNMVQDFLRSGAMNSKSNEVNICLIPKIEHPRSMTEFRPVSLCNISYKIISKVLCHRLKRILPNLVSETQSAFDFI